MDDFMFTYYIFFYVVFLCLLYIFLGILTFFSLKNYKAQNTVFEEELLKNIPDLAGVSVIAPAYNEEKTIIANVKSLLSLNYSFFEVVIVNDGSTDETLNLLIEEFDLVETPFAYVDR